MTGQTGMTGQLALTANPPCLAWRRSFPGEFGQMSVLRGWISDLLPECDARDTVILVASELGANAVRHTTSGLPGGRFGVTVTWIADMVRIEVDDGGGPSIPTVVDGADGEDGRGLRLVVYLSASLSVSGDEEGRFVRADIPWGAGGGPPLLAIQ
jgi:serine/threonine-protein kinase RsbW